MVALESDTAVKTVGEDARTSSNSSSDDENDFYDADEIVK